MIPTVNVTVAVHEQDGSPVRDALVLAKLTAVERYNGYVVADEYTGRTDERGRAVVAVFPNELGSEGSEYRFRIVTPAGKTFSVYATVPNSDCNLHQICELEPSERRGAGQVVSTEMAGYVTQAETARDKSQEAANRAQAAAVQVDVSAQTATAAASQALSNANAAKRAAEDATGLVQRTETAVAGFESEVIGRVEAETQRLGGEASTAVSTAKDQAMTALDAHMEQRTEGLDLHAADLKAALTASLGTREEEAIGAVRIERDAALVVLREEGAQFREDLNTLAERSEDAAKRAACSAAITVKAASDVDEALTDTAIDLLAPQVVAEAVRQATEIALDSANTATVEAEKSRQSAATACTCADESAASAQAAADSAAAAEMSAGAAGDSASSAASSEAVAIAKAGEATISATAAKVSEGAAKVSEESAADSARTATTKAGEATASAAAAGVSEANAAASATAASASATIASAAQTAAEAAYEETKKVAVLPATTTSRGSVMPDGLTISVTADGTISAKDVAIGGNLEDLASARGQIGDNIRINTASDLNAYTKAGNWLFSDAAAGENFPNIGRGGELNCYVSTTAIFQFFTEFNNNRRYIRYGIPNSTWTNWIQFISVAQLGDGIRNTNGIISVPEYEGATASSAGTSGLVPPAAAGQQESFLTGGGEYKPALSTGGGVMTGSIQINDPANDIAVAPPANTERGMFLGDKNSVVMGGFDVIQRASDNAKYTQFYSKNSRGDIASLAAVTYEDGTRELVADSPLQINDIQIKQVVDGGRRVIVLSGARGNQGHSFRFSPDTGEAYMDGRVIHAKADTAGYADTAGSAPANGGTAWAANRLRREGGVDTVWNWAGQGGQPGWLWGGNDGVNMYVYNPANFSVNYANSAGGARTVSINYAAYNDFPLNANFTMPFDGLAVIFVTGSGWGHIKLFVNGAEVSRARMYGEDSANPCDSPSAFVRSGIVVQGQVNGSRISGVVRCFPGA